MSNNSNNVYNGSVNHLETPTTSANATRESTAINIDGDSDLSTVGTQQQQLQQQQLQLQLDNSTRINMESHTTSNTGGNSVTESVPTQADDRNTHPHAPNLRSWRINLNNVLAFSSAPTTNAVRSLMTHSGGFRYAPLNTTESAAPGGSSITSGTDNIHLLLNQDARNTPAVNPIGEYSTITRLRSLLESEYLRPPQPQQQQQQQQQQQHQQNSSISEPNATLSTSNRQVIGNDPPRHVNNPTSSNRSNSTNNTSPATTPGGAETDEYNTVVSDIFVKVLSHTIRYLPFICILFVKFIHDHLLGILDLVLLHCIMYHINKSLREQVAKFSQKSYGVLIRDFIVIASVVAYRFMLSSSVPDPFGLLIAPPGETVTIEVSGISKDHGGSETASQTQHSSTAKLLNSYLEQLSAKAKPLPTTTITDETGSAVTITKTISLGVLLYYVAVNDLVLKLLTILVKISITMLPTRVIRHKPRARMFVLVEYISQFYRALAPVRQWLLFLFESYSGLEVISGVLFSSFYMGAKGFEFTERGKSLKRAFMNFLRNMDYERKPTKEELDAAGTLCPICHDSYNTPVVLECGHIFCDDCVSTWFKREQTCPMCRAKVSDDPTWQDGSTTFFYQLC